MTELPPWVLLHVPHDSTFIPDDVRSQFALSEKELEEELLLMTDHHTMRLFGQGVPLDQVIRAPVSRLVLDVERFEDDKLEPMAQRGMGVIYTMTQDGRALRRTLAEEKRKKLLDDWYRPHHTVLTHATLKALQQFGLAVIIDCHSFPSKPLPYEVDQSPTRPQICIGTDAFHTPVGLVNALVNALRGIGYEVGLDSPFSGSLVPKSYYKNDSRVMSVMLEVRRDLYTNEETGMPNPDFELHASKLRSGLLEALGRWNPSEMI
jgi:N-formylglutamate deformylase